MADSCCTPPPLKLDRHGHGAGDACCAPSPPELDRNRDNAGYRRALWAVLLINAAMFVVEVGAGYAAGSASLQADALDFWATPRTTASV